MGSRFSRLVFMVLITGLLTVGCYDNDYDSGIYWLNKESNPEMASLAFRRSLDKHPNRWKTHRMIIKTLSQGDDPAALEKQLRDTFSRFPDSSRSAEIYTSASSLLGDERYNRLASSFEQHHLGQLLAKKGDRPELLARIIMASCRAGDSSATISYFRRLLTSVEGAGVPDSVVQEMNFFIGPAAVGWVQHDWRIEHNPDDSEARLAQLDAGLMMGDSASTRQRLTELARASLETVSDPTLVRRFGLLVGVDPFASKQLVKGWDGSYSPDGRYIVFIKDMGSPSEPDQYLYRASVGGGGEVPLMKAAQQFLASLAWPTYSPDGEWIYLFGAPRKGWKPGDVGRFHLFRVRPRYGARPQKLTDADLVATPLYFASDGTLLLVRRDVGSIRKSVEAVRLDPKTRLLEAVSRIGEPVSGAVFTPAGDSLIFTTDRGVFRRSAQGGNITVDLQWTGLIYPHISPDGRWLLLSNDRGQTLLIDRLDGRPTYLGTTATPFVAFNPNGKLLVTRLIRGRRTVWQLDLSRKVSSVEPFVAAVKQ